MTLRVLLTLLSLATVGSMIGMVVGTVMFFNALPHTYS